MILNLLPGPNTVKKTPLRGNPKSQIPNPLKVPKYNIQDEAVLVFTREPVWKI